MKPTNQTPYQRSYNYSPSRPKDNQSSSTGRRHRQAWLGALVVLILVTIGVYAYSGNSNPVARAVHSLASTNNKRPSSPPISNGPSTASLASMSQSINSVISQNSGIDISVNLINLNNNQAEHYGVNQTFQAASTAKILTAAYFLHQVENGQQSLSETVNGDSAEYELQQMIVISDDDAWADLNDLLGYNNLQSYADTTLGINDYQAYNNSLSSGDIALALKSLWQGTLLNSSDSQLLLSYLKQANYRQYIVPAVPASDTIYHKIGLYQDYVNDAAIITSGQKAFVIVIFTNGNGQYNWPARASMMQTITRAALKAYFNQ